MLGKSWLTRLTRLRENLEYVAGSSRGERPRDCRREGTCPASWRVSADYYTFKMF